MNAWWEPLDFALPATREQAAWQAEIDTYDHVDARQPRRHREPLVTASPSAPAPSSCSATRAGTGILTGRSGYLEGCQPVDQRR